MKYEKKNPLVSICIPVFNGVGMIERALESCINQTYKNIEIIVVDNASTDNTYEIISHYIKRDKRIKYFRNEENIGSLKNFLRSFELATGEFLQLLCSDDWISKNYIEEGVNNFISNPETGVVFSKIVSLSLKDNDKFIFNMKIAFRPKNYRSDYFFRTSYNSQLGANDVLAMARRKDMIEVIPFIRGILDSSRYGILYKNGLAADRLIISKILLKYDFFTYTDKSAYVKVSHSKNLGKQFGLQSDMTILKLEAIFKTTLEYLYKNELKKYLLKFKVILALNKFCEIVIGFIKNKFSFQYLKKELNKEDLKLFFEGYSVLEKFAVIIGIIPFFIFQAFKSIGRRLKYVKKQESVLPAAALIFLEKSDGNSFFKFSSTGK